MVKIIGYFVDGHYVTIGRLQHYLKHYGGQTLEFLSEVV